MKKISLIFVVILATAISLAGCTTNLPYYQHSTTQVKQDRSVLQFKRDQLLNKRAPAVEVKSGYYVNTTPQSLTRPPRWLNNRVALQADGMPFSLLMQQIFRGTGVDVSYQPGMDLNMPTNIDYRGTLKGALQEIAAQYDFDYTMTKSSLTWQAFETRTFNISFMPGSADYLLGQTAGGNAQGARGQNSGGGGDTTTQVVTGSLGSASQFSSLQGKLSVWTDLKQTLDDLKSPEGKVSVSEATTSVTVRDHPANVRAMARYIKQLNKELSQEVTIKVQVLEINLNKEHTYGINWNLVASVMGRQIGVSGNITNLANLSNTVLSSANGLMAIRLGSAAASNVLLNALSQQGQLSVVTQPTVTTLNNQVAEVRITQDTAYLAEVSNSSEGSNGIGNSVQTQTLTPGVVTDGFVLYLLPKIQGDRIYLQISSTLSTLTSLTKVDNAPPVTPGVTTTSSTPIQSIQVPTLAEKHFNQRTLVVSGDTVIITGFRQVTNRNSKASPFGVDAIGAQGTLSNNVETIVLITPTIVENKV